MRIRRAHKDTSHSPPEQSIFSALTIARQNATGVSVSMIDKLIFQVKLGRMTQVQNEYEFTEPNERD